MATQKTVFECQNCGAQSPKWLGRCPECSQWNCYVEEAVAKDVKPSRTPLTLSNGSVITRLPEIEKSGGQHTPVGIAELDRVMGGGIVPGSVTLVGGDPGIGKSTIVLQAFGALTKTFQKLLYISGEESAPQIKLRAERLGINAQEIYVVTENCLEKLLEHIKELKPHLIAVDSIQTIYSNSITSAPGTISQVRESAAQLLYYAKGTGTPLILVGHVTKDGAIAGPKTLEHMVDTVLYFEGERGHPFRILRAVKNRFGSTNEIGVFEMTGKGLKEVPNPSSLFLAERPLKAAGSVVTASLEGSRPVLIELQALVTPSGLGNPRRTSIGLDSQRVMLLIAVLEKIIGLRLNDQDVFLNVAGGMKVSEPSIDLGVITAIHSSHLNRPLDPHTLVLGEVGLAGEVRAVNGIEIRLNEAAKMGFQRIILPKSNCKVRAPKDIELYGISSVEEAIILLS